MMIAVTAQGMGPDAAVDPRFGRCQYIVFFDPATGDYSGQENPSQHQAGGAGVNAAQFVVRNGAKALITGNVGPRASQALAAAGIDVYAGASGTVREVLQAYRAGELQKIS